MSKRQYLGTAILLCLLNFALAPRAAVALDLAGTAWAMAAAPHGHDPTLLYAIGLMESGRPREGGLAPGPGPCTCRARAACFWRTARRLCSPCARMPPPRSTSA